MGLIHCTVESFLAWVKVDGSDGGQPCRAKGVKKVFRH
jgi:hypothetical protein